MHDRKSETKGKIDAGAPTPATLAAHDAPRDESHEAGVLTTAEFASLGGGQIAYVRAMRSEDVQRIFPQAPAIQAGIKIYALLAADGSPILLTDSKDAAMAGAWENELATVALH